MGIYTKQPNGKYCVVSFGKILKYNLTEEDIIELEVEKAEADAKEAIKTAKHYGEIIAELEKHEKYVVIDNILLQKMGFTESYCDLVKHIPRKPINKRYVHNDFTTYGQCPTCKIRVQICMERGLKKCECGQMLNWD